MDVQVRFVFDDTDFNAEFEILNPPVIPVSGNVLDLDWEGYLSDKALISRLRAYEDSQCFIADIISKSYSPKEVVIIVTLMSEQEYKEWKREDN